MMVSVVTTVLCNKTNRDLSDIMKIVKLPTGQLLVQNTGHLDSIYPSKITGNIEKRICITK